jgi:hypothetical protein
VAGCQGWNSQLADHGCLTNRHRKDAARVLWKKKNGVTSC